MDSRRQFINEQQQSTMLISLWNCRIELLRASVASTMENVSQRDTRRYEKQMRKISGGGGKKEDIEIKERREYGYGSYCTRDVIFVVVTVELLRR